MNNKLNDIERMKHQTLMKKITDRVNELELHEHNGQKVITTAQLEWILNLVPNGVHNRLRTSRDKFTDGIHFYELRGMELREFRHKNDIVSTGSQLLAWTLVGVNQFVNHFQTKLSDEIYDILYGKWSYSQSMFDLANVDIPDPMQTIRTQQKRIADLESLVAEYEGRLKDIKHLLQQNFAAVTKI